MLKAKPVGTVAEREKMPFEVTPFMLYLTREVNTNSSAAIRPAAQSRRIPKQPPLTPAPAKHHSSKHKDDPLQTESGQPHSARAGRLVFVARKSRACPRFHEIHLIMKYC